MHQESQQTKVFLRCKQEHFTILLTNLQWLLFAFRIKCEPLNFAYKSLNNMVLALNEIIVESETQTINKYS